MHYVHLMFAFFINRVKVSNAVYGDIIRNMTFNIFVSIFMMSIFSLSSEYLRFVIHPLFYPLVKPISLSNVEVRPSKQYTGAGIS